MLPSQLLALEELNKLTESQDLYLRDLAATAAMSDEISALDRLKQEENTLIGHTYFPNFTLEHGQHKDDIRRVLDVKKSMLQKVLPSLDELEYLAHVDEKPANFD